MKKMYFTVGPSQIYPTLVKHLNRAVSQQIPSLNHRGPVFKQLFSETIENLKKLLGIPKGHQIFFVASALEAMERTILGCVEKNSFHLISGSFGTAWANYAGQLGKEVVRENLSLEKGLNIQIPNNAELVCITQNDTSTGVWLSMAEIYKISQKNPKKLIAIDTVSSTPFVEIDYQCIDVMFFSVQKGFGLPPGLGVMVVSPRALAKAAKLTTKGISIGSYHSLTSLSEKASQLQTPETPNLLNIYLLNSVCKDMLKKGIKKIRRETEDKAKVLYNFFDRHKKYQPFINNPNFRSPTSLVIDVKGESEKVRIALLKKGFILGAGYGDNKLNHIRIANFPSHTLQSITRMLKYI